MILQQKQLIINEHIKYMSKGNVRKYYLNEVLAQAIENEEFEKAEELKNLINKINEDI
jgi:protein-arginine kinase activator protein McsA